MEGLWVEQWIRRPTDQSGRGEVDIRPLTHIDECKFCSFKGSEEFGTFRGK